LAGVAALAFCACTPLNAPTDGGARGGAGGGSAGTSGGAGAAGGAGTGGDGGSVAGSAGTSGRGGSGASSGGSGASGTGTAGRGGAGGSSAGNGGGTGGTSAGGRGGASGSGGSAGRGGAGGASAGSGGSGSGGSGGTGGCGRFTHGPVMVPAQTPTRMICIDSTEVTQAQYQQFLTAKGLDTSGQGPECSGWNVRFAPDPMCTFDPNGRAAFPVNGVDWCDATAYCKWAGKRLCGGPTGGLINTASKTELAKAEVSEWASACSYGGQRAYPYNTTFDGQACNGGERMQTPAIVPVGSTPGCQGAFPGLFDMVGNVHEWQDACYSGGGPTPETDKCWFTGGSYHDLLNACASAFDVNRDYVDYLCDIGFRCCADP
jgi:hypothetical protein